MEVQAIEIREKNTVKEAHVVDEEIKLSLFADNMILYTEDPNDASRKLLELVNEFSKFAEYKTNTQKSLHL